MIFLFLTYVYIQGDFLAMYYTHIIFKSQKILYIININFKVMHTCGS